MEYSGAGGNVIHEKTQKQKISWHCPFKFLLKPPGVAAWRTVSGSLFHVSIALTVLQKNCSGGKMLKVG